MIRTSLRIVLGMGLLCLLNSCSIDRAQIISHPSAAKPGDTIPVLLSDMYLIVSTTPTSTQAYTRDSLHVAYGLPAGWSILSSDYYVASGLKLSKLASTMNDPSTITKLIQDSLALYMSRKSPMIKDNGWGAYFSGKTITAHNTANNDSFRVVANNVGQWIAYSSKISLSVPSGTKMDTGVALASLPIDSATLGTIKSLYGTDSIWVKAIPIVCFVQVIAGQTEGIDTLLYFTKTGPKPSTGPSLIPNYDKGDMTYVPITISKLNAVLWPLGGHAGRALLSVSPQSLTSGSRIAMSVGTPGAWRLSIVDAAGKTMRIFSSNGNVPAGNTVFWDGTSAAGGSVQAGVYCVRLDYGAGAASQTVRVMK
jgi:hypothetical protein